MSNSDRAGAPVIIAGAGPTGLTLAGELRRGGAEVVLLDRRASRGVEGSRALGLKPRTMELLDQRGIADRFLNFGPPSPVLGNFAGIGLDFSRLPSRYPSDVHILQGETEQVLEDVAAELGVSVRWSSQVTGLRQDDNGVEVTVDGPSDAETFAGSYLVGCDGSHSTVRRLTGVGFLGTDPTMMSLIADVELDNPPDRQIFLNRCERGLLTTCRLQPGRHRIVITEFSRTAAPDEPVTIEELRTVAQRVAGTDFGMHSPRWLSHFTDGSRRAERFRLGRVLLAGDAAHVDLPAGGVGMNTGMQDAFNLGWKLAAVQRGDAPDTLLDTYHDERHAADADLLKIIRAQAVLLEPSQGFTDLLEAVTHLIRIDDVNNYLSIALSGLGVRYPMAGGHPLLGYRVPDAEISTRRGDNRVFDLLKDCKPVLLDFDKADITAAAAAAAFRWAGRINVVRADCVSASWEVPGVGQIDTPSALLIRPDGHVAWVGDLEPDLVALQQALDRWCGPARIPYRHNFGRTPAAAHHSTSGSLSGKTEEGSDRRVGSATTPAGGKPARRASNGKPQT